MSRYIFKTSVCAIALFATIGFGACQKEKTFQSGPVTVHSGTAALGGPFSLIDQTSHSVTDKDFLGKAQLIYFGYTYCPDVCPTALQQMGAALALAGDAANDYQPIFITIDPERDTPASLARYVTANGFPKGLIGLSGTMEQIEAAKSAFSVYGKKVIDDASTGGVTFDHSSLIYMMDEQGVFLDIFTHKDSPQKIADRLISHTKTGH
ncbi:MAG: SCO family protein [Robiginitomaculum sp.]